MIMKMIGSKECIITTFIIMFFALLFAIGLEMYYVSYNYEVKCDNETYNLVSNNSNAHGPFYNEKNQRVFLNDDCIKILIEKIEK